MSEDRYSYFRRKAAERAGGGGGEDLRAAAIVEAANIAANASMENAARANDDIRGTGTMTQYRPHGAARGYDWSTPKFGGGPAGAKGSGGNLRAAAEVAELGAPTSFNGGAGAPAPIEVMGKGFVNPNGGPVYPTSLRAAQAVNRDSGIGEYVPPEGPKLQAAADIDPTGQRAVNLATAADKQVASAKTAITDNYGTFRKSFLGDHGDFNKEKQAFGMPVDENLNRIYQKGANLVQGGATAPDAYKAIQPDLEKHYYTPENVDRALNAISQRTGQPITPQWRANAMSGTPEAMSALYPEIRNILIRPKPGFFESAGKNLTTPTDPFATGQ